MASIPPANDEFPGDRLPFIETIQYHRRGSSSPEGASDALPIPPGWNRYVHPNGDVYFRNHQLRLTTPDNIRQPVILQYVMDAREDHLETIADDPNYARLPPDWELTISDISESTAVIGMYSRQAGRAYEWREHEGRLAIKERQHFWSFVAEYPSHYPSLPPGTEEEFVAVVTQAKFRLRNGEVFPFTEQQIDQITTLYTRLKRRHNIPALGWLLGVVMPLESIGSRMNGSLEALMEDLQL